MSKEPTRPRVYPSARATVAEAQCQSDSPQTCSPSFRLAFADQDFLTSDDTRAVRLQLEWQKFDLLLSRAGIDHTIVMFGSARIRPADIAAKHTETVQQLLAADPNNPQRQRELQYQQSLQQKSEYYDYTRQLAARIAAESEQAFGFPATVITGGGPGIMEAANRGASDAGTPSIGLNIVLPKEQQPNPYITPEFCFHFHYFAIRKMHFLMRARSIITFPGGFGTIDELIETLTLLQTGRIRPLPIVLFGRRYWQRVINFEAMVEEGTIEEKDLQLFRYADSVDEAFEHVAAFYRAHPLTNGEALVE